MTDPYYDDAWEADEDEDEGWGDLACSMGPDGQCGQAGSEWCEFNCPYRREG